MSKRDIFIIGLGVGIFVGMLMLYLAEPQAVLRAFGL